MKKILLAISVVLIAAGASFADNDDHYYSKQDVFKILDENNDGMQDFKEFTKNSKLKQFLTNLSIWIVIILIILTIIYIFR